MENLLFLATSEAASHAASGDGGFMTMVMNLLHDFGIEGHMLFAQILNFAIVAFLLYRFAFKPVLATLDERQKKISDGLQYAEEMKNKLAEAEKEHTATIQAAQKESQDIIGQARDQAKAFLDKQTQDATAKAEDMITKANEAIALEHKKMLSEVREEVTRLVVGTASKVLSKDLSEDEKSRFSKTAADELSSVGS